MIDVHAHLTSPEFAGDLADVLARAVSAGVTAVFTAGENHADNLKVLEAAAAHPILKPCLGHYPSNLDMAEALKTVELIRASRERLIAISEVGLDFRIAEDSPAREAQRGIFSLFIDLAEELSLPLVVHSRSAGHHAIDLLASKGASRVCMHAFDGKAGYALTGVGHGFYFSIPPSVARSPQKRKLAGAIPLERILLETDSPVLGRDADVRNEPAFLVEAAEAIAEIKSVELSEVLRITLENTKTLFGDRLLY